MLIGRSAELERIGALLDGARAGHAGALVLRGDPGIGKTTLLEWAAQHADGFRVLRATGVESEARIYRKLGVRSRTELARVHAATPERLGAAP